MVTLAARTRLKPPGQSSPVSGAERAGLYIDGPVSRGRLAKRVAGKRAIPTKRDGVGVVWWIRLRADEEYSRFLRTPTLVTTM